MLHYVLFLVWECKTQIVFCLIYAGFLFSRNKKNILYNVLQFILLFYNCSSSHRYLLFKYDMYFIQFTLQYFLFGCIIAHWATDICTKKEYIISKLTWAMFSNERMLVLCPMAADGCGAGLRTIIKLRCRAVYFTRPRGNGKALLQIIIVRRGTMMMRYKYWWSTDDGNINNYTATTRWQVTV